MSIFIWKNTQKSRALNAGKAVCDRILAKAQQSIVAKKWRDTAMRVMKTYRGTTSSLASEKVAIQGRRTLSHAADFKHSEKHPAAPTAKHYQPV